MTVPQPNRSIFYSILDEFRRRLSEDIRFEAQSGSSLRGISPGAIVIRKLTNGDANNPRQNNEALPGILITPGSRVLRPRYEGENSLDAVVYPAMIQFIVTDNDKDRNLPTLLWWQEQTARALNHWLAERPISNGNRCAHDCVATQTDVIDTRHYVRHQQFVCGVEVLTDVRESRGVFE